MNLRRTVQQNSLKLSKNKQKKISKNNVQKINNILRIKKKIHSQRTSTLRKSSVPSTLHDHCSTVRLKPCSVVLQRIDEFDYFKSLCVVPTISLSKCQVHSQRISTLRKSSVPSTLHNHCSIVQLKPCSVVLQRIDEFDYFKSLCVVPTISLFKCQVQREPCAILLKNSNTDIHVNNITFKKEKNLPVKVTESRSNSWLDPIHLPSCSGINRSSECSFQNLPSTSKWQLTFKKEKILPGKVTEVTLDSIHLPSCSGINRSSECSFQNLPSTSKYQLPTVQKQKSKKKCVSVKMQPSTALETNCDSTSEITLRPKRRRSSSLYQKQPSPEISQKSSCKSKRRRKTSTYVNNIPVDSLLMICPQSASKAKSSNTETPQTQVPTRRKYKLRKSVQKKSKISTKQQQKNGKKHTVKSKLRSQKKVSKKKVSSKRKKSSSPVERNIPVDQLLSIRNSLSANNESSNFRMSGLNIQDCRKSELNNSQEYEDDIYENKHFDIFTQLRVDTSLSPVSSTMSTPVLGFQANACIDHTAPRFVDCISQEDYRLYRRVFEDCRQRNPETTSAFLTSSF